MKSCRQKCCSVSGDFFGGGFPLLFFGEKKNKQEQFMGKDGVRSSAHAALEEVGGVDKSLLLLLRHKNIWTAEQHMASSTTVAERETDTADR